MYAIMGIKFPYKTLFHDKKTFFKYVKFDIFTDTRFTHFLIDKCLTLAVYCLILAEYYLSDNTLQHVLFGQKKIFHLGRNIDFFWADLKSFNWAVIRNTCVTFCLVFITEHLRKILFWTTIQSLKGKNFLLNKNFKKK